MPSRIFRFRVRGWWDFQMFAFVGLLHGKLNAVLSVENASEKKNALKNSRNFEVSTENTASQQSSQKKGIQMRLRINIPNFRNAWKTTQESTKS